MSACYCSHAYFVVYILVVSVFAKSIWSLAWWILNIFTISPQICAVLCVWQDLPLRLAWNRRGVHHMKGPPSNVQMGPQRAVAGVGTSKSDVGSGKSIHAIRSSSLIDVFKPFPTSSCHRSPHHQLPLYSNFSNSHFVDRNFCCFWFISLHFSQIDFLHSGRMAKFLPGQSEVPWLCVTQSIRARNRHFHTCRVTRACVTGRDALYAYSRALRVVLPLFFTTCL